MYRKKTRAIIMGTLILLILLLSTIFITKSSSCNNTPKDETVTVSFDSNGGSSVESIKLKKGEKLTDLPQSFLSGSAFIGWYTDEETKEQFSLGTTVDKDITLHAGFVETQNDLVETIITEKYEENCPSNMEIVFVSDEKLTKEQFMESITIEALSGELPEQFNVSIEGNEYTLHPVNGYMAGKLYNISISNGIRFKDFDSNIKDYKFRIFKENVEDVQLSDEIKYVLVSDLINYVIKDENNNIYQFILKENKQNEYNLKPDDIVCIGKEKKYNAEESVFVKITDVNKNNDNYYISAKDADISEVFPVVDVKFDEIIPSNQIIEQLDEEEIKKTIYENGTFDKVTTLVSTLLAESDTIRDSLGIPKKQLSNTEPDFAQNAYIIDGTFRNLINFSIAKDAKVTVGLGKGHNPNFDPGYTDEFTALSLKFEYEADIKNKIQVKVEFTLTEYLAVSMQGAVDSSTGKDSFLYFDYALNLYSQTDIDMTILVRTINKEEGYKDISQEIKDKLSSQNEEDPNNLVEQLKDMLESENGYIDIFRARMFHLQYNIIPILPIMQINIDFDFVVQMNFAAGLSTEVSILEATQVGVSGDTRKNQVSSYKNDLIGGNRYSIQLTACGYVGFKAGFEGGLSISFCGLSQFGKVGLFVFVGPYVDLYGFAQLSLVKDNYNVTTTLVGGYYIEIGMNLKITLEARSDLFGVKIGATLLDKKWPLIHFGNKDVLLSIESSELSTVYLENDGGDVATTTLSNLKPLKGKYIDITTGEVKEKDIPWSKIHMTFSNKAFSFDSSTKLVTYKNLRSPKPATEECIASYFYIGPYLQFNLSSNQSKDLYAFGGAKFIYYDNSIVSSEDAGKMFKVNIYTEVDGVRNLVETREVVAGSKIRSLNTGIDLTNSTNISWNKDPYTTYITEDTDLIQYANKRQTYVAFIYYNESKNKWVTEIRACNIGEKPVAPFLPAGDKSKFTGWYGEAGMNNSWDAKSEYGIFETITSDDIYRCGYSDFMMTYGKDVTKTLDSYESETGYIYLDLFEYDCEENGSAWVYTLMTVYTAQYEYDDCNVKIIRKDVDGNKFVEEQTVPFRGKISSYTTFSSLYMEQLGFALEEDGEVLYELSQDIPPIVKDTTLYLIYKPKYYDVILKSYDDVNQKYVEYKKIQILAGKTFSELELDYDGAEKLLNKMDNVEYELLSWRYRNIGSDDFSYVSTNSYIYHDIEVYPTYNRKVKITLDAGDGFAPNGLNNYYAESSSEYTIYLGRFCGKTEDFYNTYEHTGWKNMTTGEVFPLGNVVCNTPTTFVAVYTPTPKEYTFIAETDKGELKDGSQRIEFVGGYEEYSSLVSEYNNWHPSDVRDDENHCYYTCERLDYVPSGNSLYIHYTAWRAVVDKHIVNVEANGGVFDSYTKTEYDVEWNSEIDLSNLSVTKSDDKCSYKIKYWIDSDGNTYPKDGKYIVSSDTILKPVWEEDVFVNYTITYILDNKEIKVDNYHKDDKVVILGKPEEAKGLVFSGWKLYNNNQEITEEIINMPAMNIVAKAITSKVYISYYVDGKEISKELGNVLESVTVKDLYVKNGYTVTEWITSDVVVNNGSFVMPENDVRFDATTSINKYKIRYYHKDNLYKEETYDYGTFVNLISVPTETGVYFAWTSDDITLDGSGFSMPAKDIQIKSISATTKKLIIYYVNGKVYATDYAIPGQTIAIREKPTGVENWYINETAVSKTSLVMGNDDILIYSSLSTNEFTISFNIDAGFDYEGSTYTQVKKQSGEKYYLPTEPAIDSSITGVKSSGWYTIDAEILSDEGGSYIIMPSKNVIINIYLYNDDTGTGYKATTYLSIPGRETIKFLEYNINNNIAPTYFEYPEVNGYEFLYWTDEDGNHYDDNKGVILDDMNKKDKNYYGIYRKVEMHIVKFVLNGELIDTISFYDYRFVSMEFPEVTLQDGEEFSGWMNPYVRPFNGGFYLDTSRGTTGIDFVFEGFTYNSNANYLITFESFEGEEWLNAKEFKANENDVFVFASTYFDKEVEFSVEAYGFNGDNYLKYQSCPATIVKEGNTYKITLPTISSLVSGDNGPTQFEEFKIISILK